MASSSDESEQQAKLLMHEFIGQAHVKPSDRKFKGRPLSSKRTEMAGDTKRSKTTDQELRTQQTVKETEKEHEYIECKTYNQPNEANSFLMAD